MWGFFYTLSIGFPHIPKMKKQKFDERAVKIAMERLAREIELKKDIAPGWYLQGYYGAMCDFVWDYTGSTIVSLEWEAYIMEQVKKGKVKVGSIPIKDIKIISGG